MTEVLRAEDVHVVRDGRPILQEVSLTVRAGEHWALLGANGAGKSTLLSLCGALVHPTRGTVEVLGRRLGRVDLRELRAHVGHVDPRHPLTAPLRVRDIVLTGLTNSVAPLPVGGRRRGSGTGPPGSSAPSASPTSATPAGRRSRRVSAAVRSSPAR